MSVASRCAGRTKPSRTSRIVPVGGKSGARDIRNTIRRTVEDKIASLIVEKGEGNVTGILVTEKDGEIDVEPI